MSTDRSLSLGELKRNSEHARAAFAESVDDLRAKANDTAAEFKARISPGNLKEEVQDHLRASGQDFVALLKRKASENPLQTLAVGAGLAYPLWKVLRSIPAPIMLVGAGFWLAHQKSNGSVEENLTADVKEKASNAAAAVRDAAAQGAESLSRTAADLTATVSADGQSLVDKTTHAARDAVAAVSGLGQTVADKATSVTDSVIQQVSDAKDGAVALSRKSGHALLDFVQQNPLLVAGAGLALGAFVASSIPSSESENRLFGQRSDDLKNEVKRSVATGVEQAKKVASDVVGDVTAAASQQGLSAEGLAGAVGGLTASVRSVTDKGLQALDGATTNSPEQQQRPNNG